jgi:hypothetical protein
MTSKKATNVELCLHLISRIAGWEADIVDAKGLLDHLKGKLTPAERTELSVLLRQASEAANHEAAMLAGGK